jgi:hypothetical protein
MWKLTLGYGNSKWPPGQRKKNSNPKVNCTLQGQLRKKVTANKASDLFFSLKIWGKFPQKIAKLVNFTLEK